DRVGHLVGERDEALVLRDEVGLAGEFDQRHSALGLTSDDEALAGGAVGTLRVALRTLQAQDLGGLLDVSAGLLERLLGVDHSRAELLAQRLDVGDGEVGHVWWLLASYLCVWAVCLLGVCVGSGLGGSLSGGSL